MSYSNNKVTGTYNALVRDCFPPSTASIRYQLPVVISFKFLSIPPLLSITNVPRTYITSLNL